LMSKAYDAAAVGAGHNGLVGAAYPAKFGLKTLVLDRRNVVDGAAPTDERARGFGARICSDLTGHLRLRIVADPDLRPRGPKIMQRSDVRVPLDGGACIVSLGQIADARKSLARFNKRDTKTHPRAEWPNYCSVGKDSLRCRKRSAARAVRCCAAIGMQPILSARRFSLTQAARQKSIRI
jgi:phytoene dehydrogenase-like protein